MKKNEIRQRQVLVNLVDEFIKTKEAVSSGLLNSEYLPNASPATLRIDLHKLEEQNLIYQPHTSAGRVPTIKGYREYLTLLEKTLKSSRYEKIAFLRDILIKNYKDTPLALHYVKQMLAKETDQVSFVAEPEIAWGYLKKLDVFKIGDSKLLFVVSLDSGLDKTVILKCDYDISEQQLKALVRYVNEELFGSRIYDIQYKFLEKMAQSVSAENRLLSLFLGELSSALTEISSYFIHFEGGLGFLEQPEFNQKESILHFLGLMQRQDVLVNLLQENSQEKHDWYVVMGEDLGQMQWAEYCLIFASYELFDVPGYLGVLAPLRMDYRKNIPIVRDIAKTITAATKKGMMVNYEK